MRGLNIKKLIGTSLNLRSRMMLLTLVVAAVPTLAVGISSYLFSASTLQDEVNRAHMQLLENTSSNIDRELQNIQESTLQMLFHPLFSNEALQHVKDKELEFNMQVYQFFSTFQSNHNLIMDVSLYVKDNYLLSSSSGLFKITPIYDRNKLNTSIGLDKAFEWQNTVYHVRENDTAKGITFICKAPLQALNPIGLILVRIDEKLFQNALKRSTVYPGQMTAIIDQDGKSVAYSSVSEFPKELLELTKANNGDTHKLNYMWNGKQYLVTSLTSAYTGWQYIDMIPSRELNSKSIGIGVITVVVLAIVLLFALVFTFVGTRWVYRPVANLMSFIRRDSEIHAADEDEFGYVKQRWLALEDETKKLQHQIFRQLPMIQESFVMQTLQGQYMHYTQSELESLFQRYGLPQEALFTIFIVGYDWSLSAEGKFSDQDRDLIIFAMKNIIDDLVHVNERYFQGISVNMLNDRLAVLLWDRIDAEASTKTIDPAAWNASIKEFVDQASIFLSEYLRLPVTAGLGSPTLQISELSQVYRQAVSALYSSMTAKTERLTGSDNPFVETSGPFKVELEQHEQTIDRVIAYIHDHYDVDLSQDQCARDFGISRTHLSKLFKKFKRISFSDYVTQVRMEKAKEMLRETDTPVTEISEKVGYLHTQNFIRVFKKVVGVTPGQFREDHQ
ncbi:AraC family transcriptional regulator [Paenibacillus cremeus]|uniref:AraC family transcriptional regulator n=1 Tax=Paenibacillus cremeus TaxID=2163881 RepID=A0A559K616_9BACL|nr:AraC family transcriptional regulator [Paenibacillus cremeus]TVY07547.1 AraC family transcriptional regulator [Paenibacillus cremeus]